MHERRKSIEKLNLSVKKWTHNIRISSRSIAFETKLTRPNETITTHNKRRSVDTTAAPPDWLEAAARIATTRGRFQEIRRASTMQRV